MEIIDKAIELASDPSRSLNSVAKELKLDVSNLHRKLSTLRPDILEARRQASNYKQVARNVVDPQLKAQAVEAVNSGQAVKAVSKRLGIPAPTIYAWVQKENGGVRAHKQAASADPADTAALNATIQALARSAAEAQTQIAAQRTQIESLQAALAAAQADLARRGTPIGS